MHTPVRTFKTRRGRIGPTSADALARLGPALSVAVDGRPLDAEELFGRRAPLLVDVGCGDGDALVVLRDMLDDLDEVRVLFPDPWPKARHRKRRLVTRGFADLVAARLRPGGRLHVATDWPDYAQQVLDVVTSHPLLDGGVVARPDRPVTRFESRALREGRPVVDVLAVRR